MPPRKEGVRHWRNGVFAVAVCGARDGMMLMAAGLVDCPACKAKATDKAFHARRRVRLVAEMQARRLAR